MGVRVCASLSRRTVPRSTLLVIAFVVCAWLDLGYIVPVRVPNFPIE